jgi:hypothetical protein
VCALRLVEVAFEGGGRFDPVPGARREIPGELALLARLRRADWVAGASRCAGLPCATQL